MTSNLPGPGEGATRPDAAAGSTPSESDLPRLQGLEDVQGNADDEDEGAGEATAAGQPGGLDPTTVPLGGGGSPSDPMPDISGTGGR